MDTMTLVYIIIAFATGVVVGWLTLILPVGRRTNLTREETQRLNRLIDKTMDLRRGYTLSLWSEGELVDQVTIRDENWRR